MFKKAAKTPKSALVIDDSRSARYALRKMLETAGYEVDTAESAQDAYLYLERRHPQVIFLDHQMPDSDGLDVLRTLKNDSDNAHIPVVLCSGQDESEFRSIAEQAGAVAVLSKPPDPARLKALIRDLSEETQTPTAAPLAVPAAAAQASPAIDATPQQPAVTSDDNALAELRQAIAEIHRELRDIRTLLEGNTGTGGPAAGKLLQALESPINRLSQNAVAQALQQAAGQMLGSRREERVKES